MSDDAKQLCAAAKHGDGDTVRALLEKGADADAKDEDGNSPLHVAAASREGTRGDAPHRGPYAHEDVVRALLQAGARADACDDDGNTPLHHATVAAKTRMVHFLLANGADPRARNHARRTPLHTACRFGDVETANVLLEHPDCHVDPVDRHGNSPLHYACHFTTANPDLVRLLLDHGADPALENHRRHSPWTLANDYALPSADARIAQLLCHHSPSSP